MDLLYYQKRMKETTNRTIKTVLSLAQAFQNAGGSIPSMENLSKLSVLEFLNLIGPNNIVFKYDKPKEDLK